MALNDNKMSFEKSVDISLLLDFYGQMLTDRQRETTELYYNEDLSLSEIAAIQNITRAGVRDRLVKSEAILRDYEQKIGLLQRFTYMKDEIAEITALLKSREKGADADFSDIIRRLSDLS